jgi:hypothetical protein
MHGALLQLGIRLSPRACGRIMAEYRQLYGLTKPHAAKKEPKPHPFTARFRHEIWSLDIRYIEKHQIPEIKGSFYVISVMDNFSRAILASDIYQAQDLATVLTVLSLVQCYVRATEIAVQLGSPSFRGATIKAHPATPHRPRPYGKGCSPPGMKSPQLSMLELPNFAC